MKLQDVKVCAVSALVGASLVGGIYCVEQLAIAAHSQATQIQSAPGLNACTPESPLPPFSNQVCTGYGTYCTYGTNCSIVYGEPGTWNPGGYTPPLPKAGQ